MKQNWPERAGKLDFDPDGAVQRRVWARVTAQPLPGKRVRWAWTVCLVLLVGVGGFWFMAQRGAAALSEEACAELNGRYLLSKALERSTQSCPCGAHLQPYDKETLLQLQKRLLRAAGSGASAREQEQLLQCNLKYKPKVTQISLCKTWC